MIVARLSTVGVGAAMVGVALLVPAAGGIVNVVILMAALLAVPIMAPPIWALFSRYLTVRGAITATLIGFVMNLGFKFAAPPLLGISLSSAIEMAVGVGVPVLVLGVFEGRARRYGVIDPGFEVAFGTAPESPMLQEQKAAEDEQSRFGLRVLALVLGGTGTGLLALSLFVSAKPWVAVGMGVPILALAV
jgi:hypothetical protein